MYPVQSWISFWYDSWVRLKMGEIPTAMFISEGWWSQPPSLALGAVLDSRQHAGIVQVLVHFVTKPSDPNIPQRRWHLRKALQPALNPDSTRIQLELWFKKAHKHQWSSCVVAWCTWIDRKVHPIFEVSDYDIKSCYMSEPWALVTNCWCSPHLLKSSALMSIHSPPLTGAYEEKKHTKSWHRARGYLNLDLFLSEKA